ncbi:energy transducer TonB [Leisingera aquaemixtae]|uniref:energy transducer TonB n=1 Tax=Leisingera aquaemixtae TaxID=1396826 RepID=UPI0021A3E76A|nr:TonB family protein [Leisingera aquaemixtae]UWQ47917.1 TonB family protein [Leisingera aquaemixtae]
MKRAAELTVFAGIATLIHAALFAAAPRSGAQSSGAGGEALVSVQAADATVADMVEAWQRPPQAVPQLELDLTQPPPVPAPPAVPQFELAQAPRAAAQIALARPAPAGTLEVDTAAPPPPPPEEQPETAAKPAPRPKAVPEPQQARKAEQTAASRAGQRSAGSGGGAQAGQGGSAAAATPQAGQEAKLQAVWGARIRARIERRKRFPAGASGSGVAVVRITVSRSGQLLEYRIAKSSGSAAFDQAALQAVARAGTFPAAPKKLGLSQLTFTLPMRFSK